ncbi:MAG TPA: outer membrane lipoprotein carrier protein LolA [Tenuifilaceae bacterium]|nr:outer membrane lipoprotein carrier protein LolA [Tenuifilaceae bacterium]HQB79226.1 outer membrane lipoprotein carrier protein LolA [Tenuifilaceae bacterium]
MKRITFVLTLFFLSNAVFAQNAPLGKDVLSDFSKKMQSLQNLTATFTFTLENLKENITDSHEGKIVVSGKKYYLKLMGMEVYFDGTTKWQYIDEAKEVTVTTPTSLDGGFLDDPTKIFSSYEKDFKSKFIGEKYERNKQLYEVDLYPIDLKVAYSIIKLTFNKKNLEPETIKYQGKDGNNYIIQVKNFRSNTNVKDDQFTFSPGKKKIEVIDLR